ncbi:MAG: leucyl aminopeptidase [Thermoplasmatales archaeon]
MRIEKWKTTKEKINAFVLPVFQDKVPEVTEKIINSELPFVRTQGFSGKKGEIFDVFDKSTESRIILVGLGKEKDFSPETLRRAYSNSFSIFKSIESGVVEVILPGVSPTIEAKEVTFSIILASYDFDSFRGDKSSKKVKKILINTKADESVISEAIAVANAVNFTRDIANLPPSIGTPSRFEQEAKKIKGVTVKVLTREDFIKLGMGGLEGVSRAAKEQGKLVIMEYGPKDKPPVLLVGKGITFDSGGISIKPADGMDEMKFDKCGASAVLGAVKLASDLKLNKHIVGMMPLTENLPGGNAYKPGDILTHYNGVTSEILSTDAEGRLVLADALAYGVKNYKPYEIIDLATLTGACVVALGNNYAGMFGNSGELKQKIARASSMSWEKVWELPLDEDFQEQIKSKVADVKNTGGREGGAETAAAFLSRFVGEIPWVHLDIAGTAWTSKNTPKRGYIPNGATGFGVRLLYEYLKE